MYKKLKLCWGVFKFSYYEKLRLPYMTNLNVILYENWILEHIDNNIWF